MRVQTCLALSLFERKNMSNLSSHPNASLLSISLSAAVPLHLLELYEQGGITDADLAWINDFGHTFGEQADRILFRSTKRGETANLFNQLARSIAILSYAPGGVTTFGQRYEAQEVLSGFLGQEAAEAHLAMVRMHGLEIDVPVALQEEISANGPHEQEAKSPSSSEGSRDEEATL
jgi:hypothetical protein